MGRIDPKHLSAVCFVATANWTPLGTAFLYGYPTDCRNRVPALANHVPARHRVR